MCVGMAQDEAGGFGEDDTFGVADSLLAEADVVGGEGDVDIFCDILRVNHDARVGLTAEVKDFGEMNVECAEAGVDHIEVYAPGCLFPFLADDGEVRFRGEKQIIGQVNNHKGSCVCNCAF